MILDKFFLTGVLYDGFKQVYVYLNEGDKIREIQLFEIDDTSLFTC